MIFRIEGNTLWHLSAWGYGAVMGIGICLGLKLKRVLDENKRLRSKNKK